MAPKDRISSKPTPARGRTVTSKPLNPSVATAKPKPTSHNKPPRTPSVTSTTSTSHNAPERAAASGRFTRTPSNSTGDARPRVNINNPDPTVTKPAPIVPSNARAPAPPPPLERQIPTLTSDPLQVAAQVYPWLYMTSTLEACFQTAEETAKKDLEARSKQLAEEESDIADQRTRFEAEQAADLYDELATDLFVKDAPSIMQTFLSHGDACARVEAQALQLATQGAPEPDAEAPLQIYNDMLDNLEKLHTEAVELESSVMRLTAPDDLTKAEPDTSSARSQLLGVFTACLPVIRARISNLSMAQDLIDGAQENLSVTLRMESLGLLD